MLQTAGAAVVGTARDVPESGRLFSLPRRFLFCFVTFHVLGDLCAALVFQALEVGQICNHE